MTETAPPAAAAPPKRTLVDLLTLAAALDEGLLDYEVDLEELGDDIRAKVDGVVEYTDHCYARAAAISVRAKQLAAKAAAFQNKADGLLDWVARHLEATGSDKIPGIDFAIVLKRSPYVDVAGTPGPKEFLKYRGLVRRKFEWDKVALNAALQAEDATAMTIASIKRRPSVDIKPKV